MEQAQETVGPGRGKFLDRIVQQHIADRGDGDELRSPGPAPKRYRALCPGHALAGRRAGLRRRGTGRGSEQGNSEQDDGDKRTAADMARGIVRALPEERNHDRFSTG